MNNQQPKTDTDRLGLTLCEYQTLARRTMVEKCRNLDNAGLGLTGESGEVAELIKKHLYQGHELNSEQLIEELGDVLWYITLTAEVLGVGLEDIAQKNIEKLKRRYPNGYSDNNSVNRNPEAAMEQKNRSAEAASSALRTTRESILDAAKARVCGDRDNRYGKPENNFRLISKLWTAYIQGKYKDVEISPVDVCMMQAEAKIARICTGVETFDSFVDLAGYGACGGELAGSVGTQ